MKKVIVLDICCIAVNYISMLVLVHLAYVLLKSFGLSGEHRDFIYLLVGCVVSPMAWIIELSVKYQLYKKYNKNEVVDRKRIRKALGVLQMELAGIMDENYSSSHKNEEIDAYEEAIACLEYVLKE